MHTWSALSIDGGNPGRDAVAAIRADVDIPDKFQAKISRALTPGTILVATRESSNESTRSGTDFNILATEEKTDQ